MPTLSSALSVRCQQSQEGTEHLAQEKSQLRPARGSTGLPPPGRQRYAPGVGGVGALGFLGLVAWGPVSM